MDKLPVSFTLSLTHQRIILFAMTMMAIWSYATFLQANDYQSYIEKYNVSIKTAPGVDTTFPTRAQPDESESIIDVQHWIDILPYEEDKRAAGYVVYPKHGVTIPLVWPNNDDIQKIQAGELFDHYKYLENGALHYVGAAPDQGVGNMVLAVHSSFNKSDPGRYKTAGQVSPLSRAGDKVFVYLVNDEGAYDLYIYTIGISKEIPETEVSILDQNVSEKTFTLFSCYPIGTTDARWVNVATLTQTIFAKDMGISEHAAAPTVPDVATLPTTPTPTEGFTTQSVKKTVAPQVTTTKKATTPKKVVSAYAPTFLQRVTYRPVVYRSALHLITKVGFKRTNLQKLDDLITTKIAELEKYGSEAKKKKSIPLFIMIQEIVQGFMK